MDLRIALTRRGFLAGCGAGLAGLNVPGLAVARELPQDNPTKDLNLPWTDTLAWSQVLDVTGMDGEGPYWDQRLDAAQRQLAGLGGGAVYFPPGTYAFRSSIRLQSGIVLRGATPGGNCTAHDDRYQPPTRFEFPRYQPRLRGEGTPIETAFMGIYLEDPGQASRCGVVFLDIRRGHVHFEESEGYRVE